MNSKCYQWKLFSKYKYILIGLSEYIQKLATSVDFCVYYYTCDSFDMQAQDSGHGNIRIDNV